MQKRREIDNNYVHKLYDEACPKDSQFVFPCTLKYLQYLINPQRGTAWIINLYIYMYICIYIQQIQKRLSFANLKL